MSVKSIKAYIKINDAYQEIRGRIVMPFNFGLLRDEKLDEAYLNIIGSTIPSFAPYTHVRIDLCEDTEIIECKYFIIGRDNGYEHPLGTGRYRHELYLIERTKWLEAFYCQSLTFTNSIGNVYTKNPAPALININFSTESKEGAEIYNMLKRIYISPLPQNENIIPQGSQINQKGCTGLTFNRVVLS